MDKLYKALADPTRRQILSLLQEEDRTAGDIAAEFPIAWASVSHHLATLKEAGLVLAVREGQFIRYSVNTTVFQDLVQQLITLAQRKNGKRKRSEIMRKLIPGVVVLLAAAGFSVWAYPHLPTVVATHFDLDGAPNGWSSPLMAALFVPALGLVLAALFTMLPRIDPRRANYALFTPTYWTVVNAVLILLAAIHVLLLGKAMGWAVDMSKVAALGVGGLFILLGNLMSRIRPNWFMGIRTPWTLSSDSVWRKTHRFGGAAFAIAGVCIAASALVTAPWARYGSFGMAAVAALGSVIYSYVIWKREQDGSTPNGIPAKP